MFPTLVWTADPSHNTIYLTFDDGPVPGPTEFVLEVLARYDAKATFFAVGQNIQRYPALAQSIVDSGHRLANHTMRHVKGWGLSAKDYLADIAACGQELAKMGQQDILFRPPYGRITPAQAAALQGKYRLIMWSLLSGDYDPGQSAGRCLAQTYRRCKPGAVVVFHDSYKADASLRAVLPALLYVLAEEGYRFCAL